MQNEEETLQNESCRDQKLHKTRQNKQIEESKPASEMLNYQQIAKKVKYLQKQRKNIFKY